MNEQEQSQGPSITPGRGIRLLGLDQIKPNLDCRYLVKGWLDKGELSMLYGDSNVGKTFIALDLAFHVAARQDWHGNRVSNSHVSEQGTVVYIASEGGMGLSGRIEAIKIAHQELYRTARAKKSFFLLVTPVDFYGDQDLKTLLAALQCLPRKVDLIVVDTLARSMGSADENAAKDMNKLLSNIDRLRAETGAHVMMVHHTGKVQQKGARGSSALRAAVATEIHLSRKGDEVIADTKKQRDMAKAESIAFSMTTVSIGYDADGDPVNSLVVGQAAVCGTPTPCLTGQAKAAFDILRTAVTDDQPNKTDIKNSGGCFGIAYETWQKLCRERPISEGCSDSAAKTAFARARDKLVEFGAIKIEDNWVFLLDDEQPSHPSHSVTL